MNQLLIRASDGQQEIFAGDPACFFYVAKDGDWLSVFMSNTVHTGALIAMFYRPISVKVQKPSSNATDVTNE